MAINPWLATAAALSWLTMAVHVWGGGVDVHTPLLAAEVPDLLRVYISVLWHFVTAVLILGSTVLTAAAVRPAAYAGAAWLMLGQYGAIAGLFAGYGFGYLKSLWPTPQWSIFLAILALAATGLRREKARQAGR